MTSENRLPSDRELMVAARGRSADADVAWAALVGRHETAVRRFAAGAAVGDERVDAAFRVARAALDTPGMTDLSVPTLRAMRPLLLAAIAGFPTEPPAAARSARDDATLVTLAMAYGQLPEDWQIVLWHRHVDRAPAAEATVLLGRSTAEVVTLEQTAGRGLFDQAMSVELQSGHDLPPLCRPVVAALGAYRRGALPPREARAVEEHLQGVGAEPGGGCERCGERLALADRLPELLAPAIVPWVTGQTVGGYRRAARLSAAVGGVTALAARRRRADRRRAWVLAVSAVVVALFAAAALIQEPFGSFRPGLGNFFEDAIDPTATVPDGTLSSTTTVAPGPTVGDPNRVDFVFAGVPLGIAYVPGGRPLNLSVDLSTPAPVFAGGTGTVDALLTNDDTVLADVTFSVRTTPGVVFEALVEGDGVCRPESDHGATCALAIGPGDTASMSLRFAIDGQVTDRLVIDSGFSSPLDVPVEFVPHLLLGTVERGDAATTAGTIVDCSPVPACVGEDAWVAPTIPAGTLERALLVWNSDDGSAVDDTVTLLRPGTVARSDAVQRSDAEAVEVDASSGGDDGTPRVADVTELLRDAATIAVAGGSGSWNLITISSDPTGPRRLLVATTPTPSDVVADSALSVVVPVLGSAVPRTPERGGHVEVTAGADGPVADSTLLVAEVARGGSDPFGLASGPASPTVGSYALQIASTTGSIPLAASTTTSPFRVTSVLVVLDIVP